jgi:CheY-like chemotaxis protein
MPRPANALIVDDEPHVLVLLHGLLKQLGIATVWDASTGAEALESAGAHKPDVVLLDLNLPEMNGFEVLERLKAAHPDIPVIMVSAQSTLRSLSRAKSLGASGYVVKFAPKADVLRNLSELFDSLGGRPPAPPEEPLGEGGPAPQPPA